MQLKIKAPVLLHFCDGSLSVRRIAKVRNENEFKLVGGLDWWTFDGDVAAREGQDGTATLVGA